MCKKSEQQPRTVTISEDTLLKLCKLQPQEKPQHDSGRAFFVATLPGLLAQLVAWFTHHVH